MSLNPKEGTVVANTDVKSPGKIISSSEPVHLHPHLRKSNSNGCVPHSMNDLYASFEADEIELTDRDMAMVERTAETLAKERAPKQYYERELIRVRNNLQKVMESSLPKHIKIKLMESTSDLILTKMSCIREENSDVKEKILQLERLNNYMVSLMILEEWKKTKKLALNLGEDLTPTTNNSYNLSSILAAENMKSHNNSLVNEAVHDDVIDEKKFIQQVRSRNQRLEEVIIQLKQSAIPLTITFENLKDEYDDIQDLVKERKTVLEEKMKVIEELKRMISRNDLVECYKENVNPQKPQENSKVKLRDIYLDYSEKTQDLSVSKVNISTNTNMTVLKEASSKLSKAFGSLFKSKKSKVPEKILTAEVLNELGMDSFTKRSDNSKS